jgi:hypothetical protein
MTAIQHVIKRVSWIALGIVVAVPFVLALGLLIVVVHFIAKWW